MPIEEIANREGLDPCVIREYIRLSGQTELYEQAGQEEKRLRIVAFELRKQEQELVQEAKNLTRLIFKGKYKSK